ncbi:hypothetical protein [Nocardioides bruguierae]|uniref:Uncharacterized protein n=1 Tax=Nocardioides bruguierae TaxID=2945102 RepID=A0A9X2IH86_9ACTN|nr:hypothetical protein [Nocardioides bruguierae]MCM0622344.1 hypothetical protein [Nocardioides bruguierae]
MADLLELMRLINAPLLALACIGTLIRLAETWPSHTRGARLIFEGLVILQAAGAAGSAIKYLTNAPVDLSIVPVTLGGALVVVGLIWPHRPRHT